MDSDQEIKDIIVNLNDFLICPDTISGGLYITKNGGVGLLAKCATKDNLYLMRKFITYIEKIPSNHAYENKYYYEDILLPPILLDHLLGNDTDTNILIKVREHINKTAKWLDRRGILALAEMTFSNQISGDYFKINSVIMDIIKSLSERYNIHILGNCNRQSMIKFFNDDRFKCINGNIVTSSDIKELKCSKTNNYTVYDKFLKQYNINPNTCLFIETQQGYIDTLNTYNKLNNTGIRCILYNYLEHDSFVKQLYEILPNGIESVGQFDINPTNKEVNDLIDDLIGNMIEGNSIETKNDHGDLTEDDLTEGDLVYRREKSIILESKVINNILYEKLKDKNGKIFYTCINIKVMAILSEDEYNNFATNMK